MSSVVLEPVCEVGRWRDGAGKDDIRALHFWLSLSGPQRVSEALWRGSTSGG